MNVSNFALWVRNGRACARELKTDEWSQFRSSWAISTMRTVLVYHTSFYKCYIVLYMYDVIGGKCTNDEVEVFLC